MTPHEYLKIETEQNSVIASAHRTIGAAREAVDPKPPVDQLRRAEAEDIRPGLIVWHDNGDKGWFWNVVMEPRHYGDDFKAYVADDGSRYGLRGAWVYANDRTHRREAAAGDVGMKPRAESAASRSVQ